MTTIANLTQGYEHGASQPAQNDPNNALAELFIYLFAIMCAGNDTCADTFEVICAAVVSIASVAIARLPIKSLEYDSQSKQQVAKFAMTGLWILSAAGGIYAAKKEYNHYLRINPNPDHDPVETFSAIADASLAGAVVTTIFTSISAGLVHVATPTITSMYNRAKTTFPCKKEPYDNSQISVEEGTLNNSARQALLG